MARLATRWRATRSVGYLNRAAVTSHRATANSRRNGNDVSGMTLAANDCQAWTWKTAEAGVAVFGQTSFWTVAATQLWFVPLCIPDHHSTVRLKTPSRVIIPSMRFDCLIIVLVALLRAFRPVATALQPTVLQVVVGVNP